MKTYRFEYHRDGQTNTVDVHAVDSKDAFDMFYASHPGVIIANIWLQQHEGGQIGAGL